MVGTKDFLEDAIEALDKNEQPYIILRMSEGSIQYNTNLPTKAVERLEQNYKDGTIQDLFETIIKHSYEQ